MPWPSLRSTGNFFHALATQEYRTGKLLMPWPSLRSTGICNIFLPWQSFRSNAASNMFMPWQSLWRYFSLLPPVQNAVDVVAGGMHTAVLTKDGEVTENRQEALKLLSGIVQIVGHILIFLLSTSSVLFFVYKKINPERHFRFSFWIRIASFPVLCFMSWKNSGTGSIPDFQHRIFMNLIGFG